MSTPKLCAVPSPGRRFLAVPPPPAVSTTFRRLNKRQLQVSEPAADCGRRKPWDAVADVMVRRLLALHPGLGQDALAASAATVVEVPGPDWILPIAEAWRVAVLGADGTTADGDDDDIPDEGIPYLEFRRGLPGDERGPGHGNRTVVHALGSGIPSIGFCPAPASRFLPSGLVKVSGNTVRMPAVDGAMLAEAVSASTGRQVTVPIPDAVARLVTLEDLELAIRPDGDPDAYVGRVLALANAGRVSTAVPLDCLRGMDEAVTWGMELADDLAGLAAGRLAWADVDRGCLLAGPPGTGKTTWATSVAAWCGVPLVVGGLAKWQSAREGHLGHCLAAMRADFDRARSIAPCILLIDEADSFGDRSRADPGLRDYHTQVVNCLLEQLDGVAGREGVVVVGACNDPSRIDPAITRSGRLDRTIAVALPDARALAGIVRHHLGADLPDFDLVALAASVAGATGADARRWVRRARRKARRAKRTMIPGDLSGQVRGGPAPKSEHCRRAAVHEAGHAVIAVLDRPGCLRQVSVSRSGPVGGVVRAAGFGDVLTGADFRTMLRMLLAGRAAEEALLGDVSSGSGGGERSDLARATMAAVTMLGSMGLGGDGNLAWSPPPTFDELGSLLAARPQFAERVSGLLADTYVDVLSSVQRHRRIVRAVADALVVRETIDGREVERMLVDRTTAAGPA